MSNKHFTKLRNVGTHAVELYWEKEGLDNLLPIRHAMAIAIEKRFGPTVVVNEGYETLLVLIVEMSLTIDQVKTILTE